MRFKIKLFDIEGKELELENKTIGDILFESEESVDFIINAIRKNLPPNFQYKMIPEKEVNPKEVEKK